MPILCVRPTRDRLVGANCSTEILRASREGYLVEVDGPHLILQRQPDHCVEAIVNFIHHL